MPSCSTITKSGFSIGLIAATLVLAGCSGAPEADDTTAAPDAAMATAPAMPDAAATGEATVAPPTAAATAAPEVAPTAMPTAAATAAAKPVEAKAVGAAAPVAVAAAAVAAEPPLVFTQRCAVCHSWKNGEQAKIGPNVYGQFGKKMGAEPGFAYSAAVKEAGLTLDEATLDKWLENPRALVPGNKMSFPGLKDPAKRAEVIAWMKTLK